MKRARLMLTSIAVVGVVGGALAFSASRTNNQVFCASTAEAVCTDDPNLQTFQKSVLTIDPSAPSGFCNNQSDLPCSTITNYTSAQSN